MEYIKGKIEKKLIRVEHEYWLFSKMFSFYIRRLRIGYTRTNK